MRHSERKIVYGTVSSGPAPAEGDIVYGAFDLADYGNTADAFVRFVRDTILTVGQKSDAAHREISASLTDIVMTFEFQQFRNLFPWPVECDARPEAADPLDGYCEHVQYSVGAVAFPLGYDVECKAVHRQDIWRPSGHSNSTLSNSIPDAMQIILRKREPAVCRIKFKSRGDIVQYLRSPEPDDPPPQPNAPDDRDDVARAILKDYPPNLLPPSYAPSDGNPLEFLSRHWSPLKEKGVFYQFVVGKYDPPLLTALKNYCNNHVPKLQLAKFLPTKEDYTEDCGLQDVHRLIRGRPIADPDGSSYALTALHQRIAAKSQGTD